MKSILGLIRNIKAAPVKHSDRVAGSLTAREKFGEDFFGGWVPEGVDFFKRYAVTSFDSDNISTFHDDDPIT